MTGDGRLDECRWDSLGRSALGADRARRSATERHPDRPVDPAVAELRGQINPFKRVCVFLVRGLITGAPDDDLSAIATYAQAGARYWFATRWTTVWMLPMMTAV